MKQKMCKKIQAVRNFKSLHITPLLQISIIINLFYINMLRLSISIHALEHSRL